MSFFEFPHARTYDSDLGWLIKHFALMDASVETLQTWAATHKAEYDDLKDKVDGLINNLVDVISPWDSSIAYHIFSIVEYQGTNYIAVQDVPIGVMITNTEYWQAANTVVEQVNAMGTIVGDVQQKTMFIISEEEGSNITQVLTDALSDYDAVMIDGKNYEVSNTIIVNHNKRLFGNGTILTPADVFSGDYMIQLGTEYNHSALTVEKRCGIENFVLNCDGRIDGILINTMATVTENVTIYNPETVGIDIFPPNTYNSPSDANINNVAVYCSQNTPYGIRVNGTDNCITDFRTLFTNIGIHVTSRGGGTYLTRCHTLCGNSSMDDYENTIGFLIESASTLTDCYNDNFRTGLKILNTQGVDVKGFRNIWYEYARSIIRYCVELNNSTFVSLNDINASTRDDIVKIKLVNTPAYYIPNIKGNLLTTLAPPNLALVDEDDVAFCGINNEYVQKMAFTSTGAVNWFAAFKAPLTGIGGDTLVHITLQSNECIIDDMYFTVGNINTVNAALNRPHTPTNKHYANDGAHLIAVRKDTTIFLGISFTTGYNAYATVKIEGTCAYYIRRDGIALTDYTQLWDIAVANA